MLKRLMRTDHTFKSCCTVLRLATPFFICSKMSFSKASSTSSASHQTVRDIKSGLITVSPPQYDSAVIIMHGLGDSAEGFADVADMFSKKSSMKHVKFILPTAPKQPVTLNGGMRMNSWYDINSLDSKDQQECEGIKRSQKIVEEILNFEHLNHGVAYNRMILAGFSQGGAMGLYTGLQLPSNKKLAGILCMSGYLAGYESFRLNPSLADTPILHCHGTADPVVNYKWAISTEEMLKSCGVTSYELKSFENLHHTVSIEELQVAMSFIEECLESTVSSANTEISKTEYEDMSSVELKEAIKAAGLGKQALGLLEKKELLCLLKEHRIP